MDRQRLEALIAQKRKNKGLSQELLAEYSGVSLRTIQRLEAGTSKPRYNTLSKLADYLQIEPEALKAPETEPSEYNAADFQALRLINFACLAGVVLPLFNILLPLLLWRKRLQRPAVNNLGRKILSFQILWTLLLVMVIVIAPMLSQLVFGEVSVGHFPLPLFIYWLAVLGNVVTVLHIARQFNGGHTNFLNKMPALF